MMYDFGVGATVNESTLPPPKPLEGDVAVLALPERSCAMMKYCMVSFTLAVAPNNKL